MAYRHIGNLYKDQDILMFKECYAMEKIHGTSAHISWFYGMTPGKDRVTFFSGGGNHEKFVKLFNQEMLTAVFEILDYNEVTVYGEAYGGKCQRMSKTYGPDLKFVVFEVKIGDNWLSVPGAEHIALCLGLEFVHYRKVSTDLPVLDAERDAQSYQAVRNGIEEIQPREGVVLRPLIELTKNNGSRIIAKHKSEEFAERTHQPKAKKGVTLEVLTEAQAIADEWVTDMRLAHVLDKLPRPHMIEQTGDVIKAMLEDVLREADGEIVSSTTAKKAISKKTALMYKQKLKESLYGEVQS